MYFGTELQISLQCSQQPVIEPYPSKSHHSAHNSPSLNHIPPSLITVLTIARHWTISLQVSSQCSQQPVIEPYPSKSHHSVHNSPSLNHIPPSLITVLTTSRHWTIYLQVLSQCSQQPVIEPYPSKSYHSAHNSPSLNHILPSLITVLTTGRHWTISFQVSSQCSQQPVIEPYPSKSHHSAHNSPSLNHILPSLITVLTTARHWTISFQVSSECSQQPVIEPYPLTLSRVHNFTFYDSFNILLFSRPHPLLPSRPFCWYFSIEIWYSLMIFVLTSQCVPHPFCRCWSSALKEEAICSSETLVDCLSTSHTALQPRTERREAKNLTHPSCFDHPNNIWRRAQWISSLCSYIIFSGWEKYAQKCLPILCCSLRLTITFVILRAYKITVKIIVL
jgi:hypothetical protein